MNKKQLIQVLVLCGIFSTALAEVFTALAHMKGLIHLERSLTRELAYYLKSHHETPDEFHRLVSEVTTQTADIKDDLEKYLGHPINAYLLVRRFRRQWKELERYLKRNNKDSAFYSRIKDGMSSKLYPSDEDVMGCLNAIVRIQEVYRIDARQIADGKLSHKTLTSELNADHCYEIGYMYNKWENHRQAFLWFKEAVRRIEAPYEYKGELTRVHLLEFLAWEEYMTDNLIDALSHTIEILKTDGENDFGLRNIEFFTSEIQAANDKGGPIVRQEPYFRKRRKEKKSYMKSYERLCRGESLKSKNQVLRLKCYYETKLHPLLTIRPLKVEEINEDPYIVMLRDVMYDSEIDYIKNTSAPLLNRATVTNTETGDLEFADYRVSKSGWLEEHLHDNKDGLLKSINRRISAITGLNTKRTSAEALQIVNYGIAGHYEPHFDHATESYSSIMRLGLGNRIATLLFYLSDVESGGSTVFIDAEAIARPSKGDAAFWFNLLRSGDGDSLTRHAGCPVIVGSKWVCNKWIHEHGQEFIRPCKLTIDE